MPIYFGTWKWTIDAALEGDSKEEVERAAKREMDKMFAGLSRSEGEVEIKWLMIGKMPPFDPDGVVRDEVIEWEDDL